jgi:hypothetical protein
MLTLCGVGAQVLGKLTDTERHLQKLAVEEGCRDRLLQALRQLEEESVPSVLCRRSASRVEGAGLRAGGGMQGR